MAVFTKPQFNSVWAATGVKISPEPAKISQGWVVEIPPHEYDNWGRNRADQMLAHLNQFGVPVWDSTVQYQAGKSYIQGTSSGTVFRCAVTNTAIDPELDIQGNWQVAFQQSGEALLKAQNLADVPNKAQARLNLGISSTTDYDQRYLLKAQNLADVPNKASARGNMDVFSRQEVIDLINNMQPAGEVVPFARDTPPNGWLVCDGSLASRTEQSRLFAAIGTRFGAGNGTTTFQLPDLQGEFVRGWDRTRGVDPGRVFGSSQAHEIASHRHFTSTILRGEFDTTGGEAGYGQDTPTGIGPNVFTSFVGGTETRPRNIALLYCIRT